MQYTIESADCIMFWDKLHSRPNSILKCNFPWYSAEVENISIFSLKIARIVMSKYYYEYPSCAHFSILKKD